MRRTLVALTAGLLLLGGSQLPASAAAPAAPTDLQLSWINTAVVKVSWTDAGEANIVRVETDSGSSYTLRTTKAGALNEFTKAGSNLAPVDRVVRISVASVDDAGVESAPLVSPWFDTIGAPRPTFTAGTPLADGSIKLDWTLDPVPADTTPNDPLDRPSTNEHVDVQVVESPTVKGQSFILPAGTTTVTVPPLPRPYAINILTLNEWILRGGATGQSSMVFTAMTAGLTLPGTAVYSNPVQLTAIAGARLCPNPTVNCPDPSNPFVANPGIVTELQSRPDAAHPWKTIGRYSNQALKFLVNFRVYGGSQYRLFVPAWSHLNGKELTVAPAISTSVRTTTVQTRYVAVGFNTSVAQVGQPVTTTVSIQPAATVRADLQWYDGKLWRHATYIPLTNGKGTFTFKAAGRGTTRSWRVITPAMTMNGQPIAATTSPIFKLTVR
ncbi:hypothetical protein AB0E69_16825 [Kribbella sp. NPDC026611]|uniref:hypothetical protein n=1 Tax=Kribbella sp. NPDC026611 TaxID=3154911 RepID=UPI0033D09DE0